MHPLQAGSRDRLSVQRHTLSLLRPPYPCQGKACARQACKSRMIITTARKPSSKIRTFCRHLSRFTGWDYVSRGKSGLSAFGNEPFVLVGEHRGNPGSFSFFSEGRCVLYLRANVSVDNEIRYGEEPVVEGDGALAHALSKAAGLKVKGSSERVIRVNDRIEFIEKGTSYIVLAALEARGEGVA